ncbi:MAG: glycosyl hydrolase family 28 protein [Candidatus Faecivicinus sp.]
MLRIHHPPNGELVSTLFDVFIGAERTLPWYCRVSAMPYNVELPGHQRPIEQTEAASFISFEMQEPVELRLVAGKPFAEAVVRPLSRRISPIVKDREITFTLSEPGAYTVELDGMHSALHIFANPATDFGVDKSAPNVHYYGPGIHEVGHMELEDGETLFVDGGAVLYGSVSAFGKKNVRIVGYGVIDGSRKERTSDRPLIPWSLDPKIDLRDEEILRKHIRENKVLKGCVRLYSCQDCEIAGVIARDSSTFAYVAANCDRVNCEWIKTIGMWRYNSDGIDLFNSRHVRIANGFFRDFDDCIVLKGIKGWDRASLHHIAVTGCTVWCDWGSALELGAETCADEYHDILWENCDVIHGTHVMMRTHNSDRAHIHNMVFKNIRCEYSEHDLAAVYQSDMNAPYDAFRRHGVPHLIDSPVYDGPFSNDHILGRTSDVHYQDIAVCGPKGMAVPECTFGGQDAEHCNHNIVLENIALNGRRLGADELKVDKSRFSSVIVKGNTSNDLSARRSVNNSHF